MHRKSERVFFAMQEKDREKFRDDKTAAAAQQGVQQPSVLVIDDERPILTLLSRVISNWNYYVEVSQSGEEGLARCRKRTFDVVLTDLRMPGLDGKEVAERIKKEYPETEVVVMTAYGSVESAVEVMKLGAADFILKPLDLDHLRLVLDRSTARHRLLSEHRRLKQANENLALLVKEQYEIHQLVGESRPMRETVKLIREVSGVDSPVLITGETGTGKGLIARIIHFNSARSRGPFVTVHCGAIPESLLESEMFGYEKGAFTGAVERRMGKTERASGGSLFLDEIGTMPLVFQVKLLQFIEEGIIERLGGTKPIAVDARIIAATNVDPAAAIREGSLREDLYYRLSVLPIHIPPLRERPEDIPPLAEHFLKKISEKFQKPKPTLDQGVLKAMMRYPWPGNVRELEHYIEKAVILCPGDRIQEFTPSGASQTPGTPPLLDEEELSSLTLREFHRNMVNPLEKKYIERILRDNRGNIANSASQMGVTPRTLYEKMKEHGLKKEAFKFTRA
ncbi:MAG: sigma-54-dependent Fis family transcriptional regulator [Deltaproteobacteria bacterium]|nr:sigma-54-dependent Fis family transcriptional regulator [Deltaproteobacteria bacterium]